MSYGWHQTTYTTADPGWQEGRPLLGTDPNWPNPPPNPQYEIRTPLPINTPAPATFIRTFYFQNTFNIADRNAVAQLQIRHFVDDGAVFYLNGHEVLRFNLPGTVNAPVPYSAIALPGVSNAF